VTSRWIGTLLLCCGALPALGGAASGSRPPAVQANGTGAIAHPAPEPLRSRPADGSPSTEKAPPSVDLWSSFDSRLQHGLESLLESQGLREATKDGRLAVVVADITRPDAPRVAAVNGDRMMYAASLPKIAILLGAMDKIQRDGAAPGAALDRDIEQMIRYSNNSAATRVLEWVGRERLLALLQSPQVRLYDPAHNGGLWVGKDYGGNPAYRRDPLHNLSHGATAMQVARLFQLLESGALLDAERRSRMKAALGDPGIRHKFVKGLAARPEATVFRKSGTWQQFHADGALVESGDRKLVLVGLAHDPRGGDWLTQMAAPLYDLVLAQPPGAADRVARQTTY
jgi:beta-lactamase class A